MFDLIYQIVYNKLDKQEEVDIFKNRCEILEKHIKMHEKMGKDLK